MILRALLLMHQGTFNQIIEAIGENNRVQAWHEIERLLNQGYVDRYADPLRNGEFVWFLTPKGRNLAQKTQLDRPTQRNMFE